MKELTKEEKTSICNYMLNKIQNDIYTKYCLCELFFDYINDNFDYCYIPYYIDYKKNIIKMKILFPILGERIEIQVKKHQKDNTYGYSNGWNYSRNDRSLRIAFVKRVLTKI